MADDTDNQEPIDPLTVGELISLQEAAEYAGLTSTSLKDYIRRGRLKAKKIGKFWVTTRAAIDEYLASRNFDNIPKKYRQGLSKVGQSPSTPRPPSPTRGEGGAAE